MTHGSEKLGFGYVTQLDVGSGVFKMLYYDVGQVDGMIKSFVVLQDERIVGLHFTASQLLNALLVLWTVSAG